MSYDEVSELRGFDSSEREIILREAREGNPQAQAVLAAGGTITKPVQPQAVNGETRDQQRKRLTAEHHAKIVSGEIDLGPTTVHTGVQTDVRDKRDPAHLGMVILAHAEKTPICKYATYVDHGGGVAIREYDPGESRATFTARKYRDELEERAAEGDKFAISVLTTGQPGDSGE